MWSFCFNRGLRCVLIFLLLSIAGSFVSVYAQESAGGNIEQHSSKTIDLFSFKTNALEWLLTIPNFTIEIDLSKQDRKVDIQEMIDKNLYYWDIDRKDTLLVKGDSIKNPAYGYYHTTYERIKSNGRGKCDTTLVDIKLDSTNVSDVKEYLYPRNTYAQSQLEHIAHPLSRMSILLTGKWNWNTKHAYKIHTGNNITYGYAPPYLFNLWEIRPEFRYHWRYVRDYDKRGWSDHKGRKVRSGLKNWWNYDMKSITRRDTVSLNAWYMGVYTSYGAYSIKFTPKGYQAKSIGVGLTLGMERPLYSYEKYNIDLEMGFSLGLVMSPDFNVFGHNSEYFYYYSLSHSNFKVIPFPVISELRIAFALRTKSVRDKYLYRTEKEDNYNQKRKVALGVDGFSKRYIHVDEDELDAHLNKKSEDNSKKEKKDKSDKKQGKRNK